jgi:hypothetical protein
MRSHKPDRKKKYERKADEKWAAIGAVMDDGSEDDQFRVLAFLAAEYYDCPRSGGAIA